MQPVHYRGSELLQFVPEQQYRVLQRSSQLAGVHQHLGHSYGVALAAVEAAAADGKAALVVGPLALAERLKQELLDMQVGWDLVIWIWLARLLGTAKQYCPAVKTLHNA